MNNNPLVSIIIPCYNLEGYIEPCLNSCILQTYKNIEIIVLNDGSHDRTKEIIDYYAGIDKRFIIIHKENEGVAKTRKTGVEKSSGKFIFFLDGDDYLPLNAIEILVAEMQNVKADMVIGKGLEESLEGFKTVKMVNNELISGNELVKKILIDKFFGLWGILYKRPLFDETLNFHTDLKNGEDAVLLIQLAHKSKLIKCFDKISYFYRNRGTSETKEPADKNFQDSFKARFLIEKYATEYGLTKEKDFELGLFVCASLVYMLLKKDFRKID